MKYHIGAMSLGDILGRGLQLLFKRLPLFYAIELIVLSPILMLQLGLPDVATGPLGTLLVLLPTLVLGPIGTAAMLRIIVQDYLGRPVSLGEAFEFALGRFAPLLGTSILAGLGIMAGMIACCIPGIYLAVIWAVASQVVVVENISGSAALNRSKSLVQGYAWRVCGLLFLVGLGNAILAGTVTYALTVALPFQEFVPGQAGFGGAPAMRVNNYTNYAIVQLTTTLVNILTQTFAAICSTLLYFDLRNRKEGFDLDTEADQIGSWRAEERTWGSDEAGLPGAATPPQTGIKEPDTALPPPAPETGIRAPDPEQPRPGSAP